MVSAPTYDPADPPSSPEEGSYINRFTSSTFVPGSVFKLVTAAAAIENLDDAYTWEINCTGSVSYGGQYAVTDETAHGTVDLEKALEVSCNCYFGQLAEKLGPGLLEKYVEKAGLTTSYDINGIKTAEGSFSYPDSGMNLAWTGIGPVSYTHLTRRGCPHRRPSRHRGLHICRRRRLRLPTGRMPEGGT